MTNKKPKLAFQITLVALLFTFMLAACNNSGKDKEVKKDTVISTPDSVVQKPTQTGDKVMPDTTKHKPTQTGD